MQPGIEATISTLEFPHVLREEVDHRIANSLQIISSLVRQRAGTGTVSDPQTFLMEVADRIDTVGKLHLFLARSMKETVQLDAYLKEICERLTGALAPTATSLAFDCPADCSLSPKLALPVGLITAELVSNSLKYAHPTGLPTKITLSCSRDGASGLNFVYEDDGVGFPEDFDISAPGHMGMRFIELLSKGIAGNHNWLSDSLGIRFEIALANVLP